MTTYLERVQHELWECCRQHLTNLAGFEDVYIFGSAKATHFARLGSDVDNMLLFRQEIAADAVQRTEMMNAARRPYGLLKIDLDELGLVGQDPSPLVITPFEIQCNVVKSVSDFFEVNEFWSLKTGNSQTFKFTNTPLKDGFKDFIKRLQAQRANFLTNSNQMRACESKDFVSEMKPLWKEGSLLISGPVPGTDKESEGRDHFLRLLKSFVKQNPQCHELVELQKKVETVVVHHNANQVPEPFRPKEQMLLWEFLFDQIRLRIEEDWKAAACSPTDARATVGGQSGHVGSSPTVAELLDPFLAAVGSAVMRDWARRRETGRELEHYVCNHFEFASADPESANDAGGRLPTKREREDAAPWCDEPNPTEQQILRKFFEVGIERRWLVTEDAGAGKSVFTRRLQAWFCDDGPDGGQTLLEKSALVVRWEGGRDAWPTLGVHQRAATAYRSQIVSSLREDLENGLIPDPEGLYAQHLSELVNLAWKKGRVVLLLDALDQVEGRETGAAELAAFIALCEDSRTSSISLVVTSRPRSVADRKVFPDNLWRHLILKGFTPQQQFDYLRSTLQACTSLSQIEQDTWQKACAQEKPEYSVTAFAEITPAEKLLRHAEAFGELYPQIWELLQVPALLTFVRDLAQPQSRFPRFTNRADLYWQAIQQLWERENTQLTRQGRKPVNLRRTKVFYRQLLAAVAYQMLLDQPGKYIVVNDDKVTRLEDQARQRCLRGPKGQSATFVDDDKWNELWDGVDDVATLTRHLIVEQANKWAFGFKHRGMQEFFAGLYLAQMYSTADDEAALAPVVAEDAWFWPLRFAAELREAGHGLAVVSLDDAKWREPLDLVFSPTVTPCPNELRWHLLRIAKQEIPKLYTEWRRQLNQPFRDLLARGKLDDAQTAAQLLPVEKLESFAKDWGISLERLQELLPKVPTWVCCPPESIEGTPQDQSKYQQWLKTRRLPNFPNHYWFWQGTDESAGGYGRERPRHKVAVPRFWMQATTVTKQQYELFDPGRCSVEKENLDKKAKDPKCPMIQVSWYDAALFACWVGDKCRLPSETEWEFACRAGFDGEQDLFSLASGGSESLDGSQANFNGDHPHNAAKTKQNACGVFETLPVRWTAATRQAFPHHTEQWKPPAFAPNVWGLWQMHGNVWEWCADVYRIDEYQRRVTAKSGNNQHTAESTQNIPFAPNASERLYTVGPSRVLRGGSCNYDGVTLRCASRYGVSPGSRHHNFGFRLCWGE